MAALNIIYPVKQWPTLISLSRICYNVDKYSFDKKTTIFFFTIEKNSDYGKSSHFVIFDYLNILSSYLPVI